MVPCPCCQGVLVFLARRRRIWIQSTGEITHLLIRRLKCTACGRIHHELPDLLVPYKRHEAASIERAVSNPPAADIAVEESTLNRWRRWFAWWAEYAKGCLESIACRFGLPVEASPKPLQAALHPLGHLLGDAPRWLARAVRPIANANLWVHTRSALVA